MKTKISLIEFILFTCFERMKTKISLIEFILFTCFERMKTTSPSRQNIPQHIPCSLQEGLGFRIPEGVLESVNPELALSHCKIECTRTYNVFSYLPEVSTWMVAL